MKTTKNFEIRLFEKNTNNESVLIKPILLSFVFLTVFLASYAVFGNVNSNELSVFAVNDNSTFTSNTNTTTTFATSNPQTNQSALNVGSIYNQKTAQFDNNVQNVVVLIPDEGHESINQKKSQWPLANAPYIPQNIIVNKGTAVTWFSGDVDHNHIIKFQTPVNGSMSETQTFPYLGHVTVVFNKEGQYPYFEDGDLNDDKSFKMTGTVKVINSPNTTQGNSNNSSGQTSVIKTAGFLMVPSKDSQSIISTLTNEGYKVLGSYTFKDIRGGQKGTGPTQTIIAWASDKDNVEQLLQPIVDITKGLPYS